MPRMVVKTSRGHVVTDVEVTEQQVAEGVARWMQVAPDCAVYVDNVPISDEVRRAILAASSASAVTSAPSAPSTAPIAGRAPAPAPPLDAEQLRSAADAIQYAYRGVVKGWLDLLDYTQEFARRSADEAARQRELTHKSLKDIDLLDRSVAAAALTDRLAAAGARSIARTRLDDRMQFRDLAMGALRVITGNK